VIDVIYRESFLIILIRVDDISRAQRKTVVTHFFKNVQEEEKTFHIS